MIQIIMLEEHFSEGIKASSNNLIFLLEDDDMFTENKISRIFEIVKILNMMNI